MGLSNVCVFFHVLPPSVILALLLKASWFGCVVGVVCGEADEGYLVAEGEDAVNWQPATKNSRMANNIKKLALYNSFTFVHSY